MNKKIKSKQNYRSISNRDTPINMLKLRKKFINERKSIVLKSMNYDKNTPNEVNYAEDEVFKGAINTLGFTKKVAERVLIKDSLDSSNPKMKIKQVENSSNSKKGTEPQLLRKDSIPNNGTEQLESQKIKLKQNCETQKIYQKVYFIKKHMKYLKINKKVIKKQEYERNSPVSYTYKAQEYKNSFDKQELPFIPKSSFIKQKEYNNLKDIKSKAPSLIKQRDVTYNKIDEQKINQVRMKENYKKKEIANSNNSKKPISKTERGKKIGNVVTTSTKKGLGTTIIGLGVGLVIIIVTIIVMISAFLQSSIGFLFADDSVDYEIGDISIGDAKDKLEQELDEKVEEIKSNVDYDKLLIYGMNPNWKEILSIYAVLGSNREGIDVTSMKEENLDFLRKIFWKVCEIDWDTSTYTVKHVYTENGERVEEYVERTKLEITLKKMDLDEMAGKYSLSNKEHEQLMELQKPEYEEMWAKLLAEG